MADEKDSTSEKMNVGEKIRSVIDKGVEVSKKGLKTAGSAISEFGDKSVLRIELAQLKAKLEKTYIELGKEVYQNTSTNEISEFNTDDILSIKDKINTIINDIKKHEENIKAIESKNSKEKEEN